jgi:predicted Zn finger-like uncharacterized protein
MSKFVKVTCPNCAKEIFMDPSEVPKEGKSVICSACATSFRVKFGKKETAEPKKAPSHVKRQVVAIEDSKFARTQITDALLEEGIEVIGVETAGEGIKKIIEFKPKVVIVDIFLGAGNPQGLDVIRGIKKGLHEGINKDIKIIMYTIMSEDKVPLAIRKMADSFIHKGPTALFHLREEVHRLLSQK